MNHLIFFSGGAGSHQAAKRTITKYGPENVFLMFTDTFIEDEDLYRFLIESAADLYGLGDVSDLLERTGDAIPNMANSAERKAHLIQLAQDAANRIPQLYWTFEGRDVWEVLNDRLFMSSSRIAHCSEYLKKKAAKDFVKANFKPEEWTLYFGIDWTEEHRKPGTVKNWKPYSVEFPLCEEPLISKNDMIAELNAAGIETPRLYKLGFAHNNCGGFCVRAGQGHFVRLLEQLPERYAYHEQKEQELMQRIVEDKDDETFIRTMMKRTKNGETQPLSMKQLREEYEQTPKQIDIFDIGGCGCFLED